MESDNDEERPISDDLYSRQSFFTDDCGDDTAQKTQLIAYQCETDAMSAAKLSRKLNIPPKSAKANIKIQPLPSPVIKTEQFLAAKNIKYALPSQSAMVKRKSSKFQD